MKLLFDTNILLDVLISRPDPQWGIDAALSISSAKKLNLQLCLAAISVPTVAYVIRCVPPKEKKRRISLLLDGFTILPSTDKHVAYALKSAFRDVEDAMQYACAKEHGCQLIITRDVKDFKESDIPVLSPVQFLKEIGGG